MLRDCHRGIVAVDLEACRLVIVREALEQSAYFAAEASLMIFATASG
jgi:hypothetical protein